MIPLILKPYQRMWHSEGGIVLVTGGTGFIGRWLVRVLLDQGARVRLLCRSAAKAEALFGPRPEIMEGDILDAAAVRRACDGARVVYHIAGLYAFGARHRRDLWAINVGGTENVLAACWGAAVEAMVHCSTAGILISRQGPASRRDFPARAPARCHYKQSKWRSERAVLDAAERGLPVTIASPTAPIGAGDDRPTPTGQMIRDLLRGRFPFYSNTGLNLIAVQDVAEGLVAIGRRGVAGERYILGDWNMWLKDFLSLVASKAGPGVRFPKVAMPWPLIALGGILGEFAGGFVRRFDERLCWETAYFARRRQFFELESSYEPLGWRPSRSLEGIISETVAWFSGTWGDFAAKGAGSPKHSIRG